METISAKYETDGKTLKITLTGEIDHHCAKAIRGEIDRQIYHYKAKTVVLDLKNVGFMDSSGLGLILGRYTAVKATGGEMKLLDPCAGAERVLKLSGTEKIIPIVKSDK